MNEIWGEAYGVTKKHLVDLVHHEMISEPASIAWQRKRFEKLRDKAESILEHASLIPSMVAQKP